MEMRIVQVTDVKKMDSGDHMVEFLVEPAGLLERLFRPRTKRRLVVSQDVGSGVSDLYTGADADWELSKACWEMVRRFKQTS